MKKNRKLIYLSLLSAIGIVLGLFESVIPIPVAIPGARLGLSNIVVLVTIVAIGYKEGFFVSIFKTIILGIVTGAVSSFFFSIGGAILSSISMILAHKFLRKYLSLIGISEIGSFFSQFRSSFSCVFYYENYYYFSLFTFACYFRNFYWIFCWTGFYLYRG